MSGTKLDWFDEAAKARFIPHVIEPSVGVDRVFLALLTTAYHEDEVEGEKRIVLRLPARVAPFKAAVFPLLKNKPALVERAEALYRRLKKRFNVFYDESGNIGRRYRRQDEIGTPFGITIDFDTIEKDAGVTVRNRDTLEQVRMTEDEVVRFLDEQVNG